MVYGLVLGAGLVTLGVLFVFTIVADKHEGRNEIDITKINFNDSKWE